MSGGFLRGLLRRRPAPSAPQPAAAGGVVRDPPLPLIYAVGDVHGRLDLFCRIEAQIAADRGGNKLIVLLGDIVDRGPDSAGMIDHLLARPPEGINRICLLGNHEEMALRFLRDPDPQSDWLSHGGAEMLASYGIARDLATMRGLSRRALAMRVASHVPEEHLFFLENLPLFLRAGPYFFCHAGVDPDAALTAQHRHTLLWSRRYLEEFGQPPPDLAADGLVVQGHVPIEMPLRKDWRINVDTGAYSTGRLAAVRLAYGEAPIFLTVEV